MLILGILIATISGAWWNWGRLEHSTNVKKKVGVALLNAGGWLLIFVALIRWWWV